MEFQPPILPTDTSRTKYAVKLAVAIMALAGVSAIVISSFQFDFNKGSAAGETLTANCAGGNNPRVVLNWNPPADANSNQVRKADGACHDADCNEFFTLIGYNLGVTTHTDRVSLNQNLKYQIKYKPSLESNTVSISTTLANCTSPSTSPSSAPSTSPSASPSTSPSNSVAIGDITGVCSNWPEPQVALKWTKPSGSTVNTLRRADGTGPTSGDQTFYRDVPLSPAGRTDYTDRDPLIGAKMQYYVKHTANTSSNVLDVQINAATCGGVVKAGDVNGDGKVDILDSGIVMTTFGSTTDLRADLNKNGRIDIFDYNIVVTNFGK